MLTPGLVGRYARKGLGLTLALCLAGSLVWLSRRWEAGRRGEGELLEEDAAWLQQAGRAQARGRGGLLHRKLSHVRQNLAFLPERFALCDLVHGGAAPEGKGGGLDCPTTRTSPHFPICVYSPEVDKYISGAILSSGVWEPYITRVYQIALNKHPTAVVVDIGANIGYYSFLAARMGHHVIAVEPVAENVRRFQRGAQLGRVTESVYLLHNALADAPGATVALSSNPDNQGGIKVLLGAGAQAQAPGQAQARGAGQPEGGRELARTITLDDLLLLMPLTQAIIKIDVEGFECRAMGRSEQFFSRVDVPYIFMEWQQMFAQRWVTTSPCPMAAMAQLANLLADRGYIPHEVRTGIQLNPQRASQHWKIGDVYWRHQSQPMLIPPL